MRRVCSPRLQARQRTWGRARRLAPSRIGVRKGIETTEESKDFGSNDLLMGDVLRRHEMQVWFLAEHVVDIPLVDA